MSVVKICEECLDSYRIYQSRRQVNQKLCPRCQAKRQARHGDVHSIPLHRNAIFARNVRVESLPPGGWEARRPKTSNADPYYRLEVRGSALGYPWEGQVTLFADRPIESGEVVFARVMRSIHQQKKVVFPAGGRQRTAVLPVSTMADDLPGLITSGKLAREAEGYPLLDDIQVREYVRLETRDGQVFEPGAVMRWLEGDSDDALWATSITGGERTGTLAIVAADIAEEEYEFEEEEEFGESDLLGAETLRRIRQGAQ